MIIKEELADHPNTVRAQPETDGDIVYEFLTLEARLDREINRHRKCRENHAHSNQSVILHPAGVLHNPQKDVQIFRSSNFVVHRLRDEL